MLTNHRQSFLAHLPEAYSLTRLPTSGPGSDKPGLGKLTRLSELEIRRDVWRREAEDMSRWMRDNIRILNDELGLQTEIEDQEAPGGNFRLDLRIDVSKPAPNYLLVVEPGEGKQTPGPQSPSSPKAANYEELRPAFLPHTKQKLPGVTRAATPQALSYFSTGDGVSGFLFGASITGDGSFRVELYIDTGDREQSKSAFAQLKESQGAIHDAIGEPLDWEELPERRASRIAHYRTGTIDDPSSKLQEYAWWAAERTAKLRQVFGQLPKRHELS